MAEKNKLTASAGDQPDPSLVNRLMGALGQTWPARLAQDAWSGVTAPGDAYNGNLQVIDPATGQVTDDAIARAASLAGVAMTGGAGGVAGDAGAVLGSGPIRAYHGSPHDFDAFDLSKIGTGEGAQAYGHGLYFAENPGVAQAYRDALEGKNGGALPPAQGTHLDLARKALDAANGDKDTAIAALNGRLNTYLNLDPSVQTAEGYDNLMGAMQAIRSGKKLPGGKMYEVGIHADPQRFLDYDTPLGGKPRWLDQALKPAGTNLREVAGTALGDGDPAKLTGRHIYQEVENYLGSPEAASQALQQGGIPGIKYLDQGSRGVGGGSSNLVVFNPQIVEIMRKYGVASMAALPPAVQFALGMRQGQPADQTQQPAAPINRLLGPSA